VPHVVDIYTAFADEKYYYIVMELCKGGDLLERLIKDKKVMKEDTALFTVVLPLLDTLCHIHSLSIVHRDVKLENIFLDEYGKVRLGDFGLTMCMFQESAISPVGTVEYMAPEVVSLPPVNMILNGRINPKQVRPTNEKVDIWAMGVTLFELVAGKLPFEGHDKHEIKQAILDNRFASFPKNLSVSCQAIIGDMLSYFPDNRPSAFTLRRKIARIMNEDSIPKSVVSIQAVTATVSPYHQSINQDENKAKVEESQVPDSQAVGVHLATTLESFNPLEAHLLTQAEDTGANSGQKKSNGRKLSNIIRRFSRGGKLDDIYSKEGQGPRSTSMQHVAGENASSGVKAVMQRLLSRRPN